MKRTRTIGAALAAVLAVALLAAAVSAEESGASSFLELEVHRMDVHFKGESVFPVGRTPPCDVKIRGTFKTIPGLEFDPTLDAVSFGVNELLEDQGIDDLTEALIEPGTPGDGLPHFEEVEPGRFEFKDDVTFVKPDGTFATLEVKMTITEVFPGTGCYDFVIKWKDGPCPNVYQEILPDPDAPPAPRGTDFVLGVGIHCQRIFVTDDKIKSKR